MREALVPSTARHTRTVTLIMSELPVSALRTFMFIMINVSSRRLPLTDNRLDLLIYDYGTYIGAVKHLNRFLNSENMKLVYEMFIRSVMEYGSVAYMGAKPVHLVKLEKVQRIAQRIGNFAPDFGAPAPRKPMNGLVIKLATHKFKAHSAIIRMRGARCEKPSISSRTRHLRCCYVAKNL